MKFVNNKLFLTLAECVDCGLNKATILDAKTRRAASWDIIDDPADRRKILIGYQELSDSNKRLIEDRMGNPYDLVVRMPILAMVVNDWKANEYYRAYQYASTGTVPGERLNSLTLEAVTKYTRAASWLGLVNQVSDDNKIIKKKLGISITDFYEHVKGLIVQERNWGKIPGIARLDILPADFPSSYQRLLKKGERYRNEGYNSIIDPAYGNQNAVKIGKPAFKVADNDPEAIENRPHNVSKTDVLDLNSANKGGAIAPNSGIGREGGLAVIRACIEKGNNFDAGQVTRMANMVFEKNGLKTISRATVHNILSENEHLFTAGRKGTKAHKNTIARQVVRKAPEYPLYYCTLDGWTVELMFQERVTDKNGNSKIEYKRMCVVVVLDAMNKYPVGYAIGEREDTELIRQANRNAIIHIKELFGNTYRPWQLQSDRYQLKNLTPFYQAMTHLHTPAAVGNSKSKVIEPYFMYLNKHYCQMLPNWTGFNVTASAHNQVNTEWLDKTKHSFPDRAGVMRQIEKMMERERGAKGVEYVNKWAAMPDSDKQLMGSMDYLMVFGKPLGKTNRCTGQGVVKQIANVEYVYDSFDPAFRRNMNLDWQLIGDLTDLSRVLAISPDQKLKFVLETTRVLPMDIRSTTKDDVDYRTSIKELNSELEAEITELYGNDATLAREVIQNTPFDLTNENELALKVMLTYGGQQKERLQDAKGLEKAKRGERKAIAIAEKEEANDWQQQQDEYMRGLGVNFNEYANI